MTEREANTVTREYLDSLYFEERLIGAKRADTQISLFGEAFSTPVMMAAFSHLGPYAEGRDSGLVEYSRAMKEIGAVNMIGMCENEIYREVAAVGARTIRIIKPYEERDKIFSQLKCAEMAGALAVGMDIDHIFGRDGEYDICLGEHMTFQTEEMLRDYVDYTSLPFVLKGVLSVQDAVKAARIGASAILVSHHHGRLPYAIPPVLVLPEIRRAVEGSGMKIFVDCGIRSGYDAFRAIALGADGVSVGREMLEPLKKDGTQGVKQYFEKLTRELRAVMNYTGTASPEEADLSLLYDIRTGRHPW